MTEPEHQDSHAVWEEHYSAKPRVWSGRVNAQLAAQLAAIAPTLPVGRALDLGCGEGADALWLADHGWTVVAVDVSPTALSRARAAAEESGVAARIEFAEHDLAQSFPEGTFDLVSAQFLHSTVAFDRTAILRRAAAAVAPGGSLLIVDHAAAPPWATRMHHHEFPTPDAVLAGLGLDEQKWQRVRVGSVERTAVGPDGAEAILEDNVILLNRKQLTNG
jgi:SAM-dependent methyltransferase